MTHQRASIPNRSARTALGLGVLALASAIGSASSTAFGQNSIGFQPTIGSIPDGAILNVTPVVSADRRYVRMGIQPQFIGFLGFDTITVPILVSGGGGGLGGGGGNIGGGGGFPSFGPGIGAGPLIAPAGYQVPDFAAATPGMPAYSPGDFDSLSAPSPSPRVMPRPKARASKPSDPGAAMAAAIATATAGKAPETGGSKPSRRPRRR